MAYLRLVMVAAIFVFFACTVQESLQANSSSFRWKELPAVQDYMRSNPRLRRMLNGPLEQLIDLLLQLLTRIIEVIINRPLQDQLDNLNAKISLLEAQRK